MHSEEDHNTVGDTYLLSIIEVDKERRILCQALGCGHSVYKRIHVVKVPLGYTVVGSECFKRLFVGLTPEASAPKYYSTDGRPLTADEHDLLVRNTEEFVSMLERSKLANEALYAEQMERQRVERERQREEWHQTQERLRKEAIELAEIRQAAMGDARRNCKKMYPNLNLESPGWQGLIYVEMLRLVRTGENNEERGDLVQFKPVPKAKNWSLFDDEN